MKRSFNPCHDAAVNINHILTMNQRIARKISGRTTKPNTLVTVLTQNIYCSKIPNIFLGAVERYKHSQ